MSPIVGASLLTMDPTIDRHGICRRLGVATAALLLGLTVLLRPGSADAGTGDPRAILADLLMNRAVSTVANQVTLPEEFELALLLAVEAATVAENDPDLWRAVVQLADLADAPSAAEAALREITRIDPHDEVAALRRLTARLDRLPTVEARREAVERLFRRGSVPAPMASRIALDLALLLQRAGDLEGYFEWLAEAVALDPANAAAVSELAGYLAGTTADPTLRTELLMARCLANPIYLPAIADFAHFLSHQGADRTALRLRLLLLSIRGGATAARTDELMFAAMAAWAVGDDRQALDLIQRRQDHEDAQLRGALTTIRQAIRDARPTDELSESLAERLPPAVAVAFRAIVAESDPIEGPSASMAMRAVAPIPAVAASAPVAILHPLLHDGRARGETSDEAPPSDGDDEAFLRVAAAMVNSLRAALARQPLAEMAPTEAASVLVAALWLLHDTPLEEAAVNQIVGPIVQVHRDALSPYARGWLALRAGQHDDAMALFEPLVAEAPLARLGMATALLEQGRRADAARHFLELTRLTPSDLAGVWARKRLELLLGTPVAPSPNADAVESIASTLPRSFDRLLLQPSRSLAIVVRTPRQDYGLLERVEVELEISNRGDLPLAIGTGGPILTTVALPMEITSFGTTAASRPLPMPIFVDVARRLRIEPWESLTVRANLSRGVIGLRTTLGSALTDLSPIGTHTNLRGRAILNPIPAPFGAQRGIFEPTLLGSESQPFSLRVLGAEQDPTWFDRTVAILSDPASAPDPLRTAVLLAWVSRFNVDAVRERRSADAAASAERDYEDRVRALELAFPRLDSEWQAVAAMMLVGEQRRLEAINWAARRSADRTVRLAALISSVTTAEDPYIDEIRRGDDPTLRRIAELHGQALARRAAGL